MEGNEEGKALGPGHRQPCRPGEDVECHDKQPQSVLSRGGTGSDSCLSSAWSVGGSQ